ncbi:MAG TPA: hypothetical protein VH877_25760 [Polyangia bacterium]|jgi:hypothetical protein|nr:hypothetical protein [Polyangia bacterium]
MTRKALLMMFLVMTLVACSGPPQIDSTGAVGSGGTAPTGTSGTPGATQGRNYRLAQRSFERLENDGTAYRLRGKMIIAYPGQREHQIHVALEKQIAKGEADLTVIIYDATTDVTTSFKYNDEGATATVATNTGAAVPVTFNADETIAVDGQTFQDVDSATDEMVQTSQLADVSPEVAVALNETLDQAGQIDDSAKGHTFCGLMRRYVCTWGCKLTATRYGYPRQTCGPTCAYAWVNICTWYPF